MHLSLRLPLFVVGSIVMVSLSSCSGPKIKGLPKKLPVINLHGSKETPPHSMAKNEYPFDSNGDYKSEWAAGSSRPASESDYSSWRSSHGGEPTPKKDYSPPAKKKKTTSSSKSSGKSSSYTIKSGDSLSTIAARNKTTVAKIKAANGLKSDLIRAGKTLKIPK